MSLPEGWEWLDELPEEWSPPADLRVPTGIPRVDLPIQMLSSNALGNDLIDLVGRFLSEGARFSMWFAREAKSKAASAKEFALLSMVSHNQTRVVYEAWREYISAFESSGRLAGTYDNEAAALEVALRAAVAKLSEARETFGA